MYDFNIELPEEVLTPGKHKEINFSAMRGKTIIGLMGYAKSGKDFITKTFIDDYGYHRVAFADNIKKEMNQYLKELVYLDIEKSSTGYVPIELKDIDFFTENLELKKVLRPYIIWYGEKIRNINGIFCWINKAFEEDAAGYDKIILSDVRRMAELDIFKDSNEFNKRRRLNLAEAGILSSESNFVKDYGTLLFEVSQLGLQDSDILTLDTIRHAHENWIIDDIFYVDPRIPDIKTARQTVMSSQIKRIAKKFGIEKPDKVSGKQTNIFQHPGV